MTEENSVEIKAAELTDLFEETYKEQYERECLINESLRDDVRHLNKKIEQLEYRHKNQADNMAQHDDLKTTIAHQNFKIKWLSEDKELLTKKLAVAVDELQIAAEDGCKDAERCLIKIKGLGI